MRIFNEGDTSPIPFITDSHFGAKNFHKGIFRQMIQFYEEQFFPWCLKHNVKNVVHCGDLVHNRNIIDLWVNQQIKRRFFQWFENNNVNLHIIVGNHDIYYKNTIEYNYLAENANEFPHILIYQEQEKIQIGRYTFMMVPWVINDHGFTLTGTADICCGHFDMVGFRMNGQMYSQDGFDVNFFKEFKHVFSGHYHIRSQKKNVYYVGTQYPITWNDYGEDKGYYVLKDDFEITYIDNKVNARFIKIYYNEVDGTRALRAGGVKKKSLVDVTMDEAIELAKKNYCKVVTNNIVNRSLFDEFYQSLMLVTRDGHKIEIVDANEIVESYDLTELEQQIQEESDLLTTVSSYVGGINFEKDVDKNFLMSLFKDLYRESSEKVIDR